jgi:hypothetical protein
MSSKIYEVDDFDVATVTAKHKDIETVGPELKISKGTVVLHFIRKSIRYKKNNSYKQCNEGAEIPTEGVEGYPDFETFYAPLRPGFLYVKIFHGKDADTDYLEFQVTEIGTLILRSKSKGQVWTEEERGIQNTDVPYLTLDKKSFVYATYSEVRWDTKYAGDQFFNPSDCFQYFDTKKWYKKGAEDGCIKGEAYQNTYFLAKSTKQAFDRAYKSYINNKDDWDYEEDAFMVLEDDLGQISDLCYEILHANISITAAMMAPLLSSKADVLLNDIVSGKLDQAIERAPEIDYSKIPIEQTDLKAREKARNAIHEAKRIILAKIDNSLKTERANIELNHYLKNDLFAGKFRALHISRFLLTPSDFVDFMIKDEESEPDPGIKFIEDFFATEGYLSSSYYAILTQIVDIDLYKLSKTHFAFWREVIDVFGTISIYEDVFYNQKKFMDILTSVNLKNGEVSCTQKAFSKVAKRFHVEDYVLDMPDEELKALEKKYNAILPPNRRFIYPETEFTSRDYKAKGFEVKTIAFNYKGLAGMDDLNGLRSASRELYELIDQVNQKAIAWVSEENFGDVNAPSRTNFFTNLDDYAQHILKRQFGIPGDNPNGMVFPDPNNSEDLVYTGLVFKGNTANAIFDAYYKVYALPYNIIKGIGCEILTGKIPNRVSCYVRRSSYGSIQSLKLSYPTQLSPEPFNLDGTLNIAYTNSSNKRKVQMLQSHHVSDEEKASIFQASIHQAQHDFVNHPVTKGAIFILTSVITAGMMQGVSAGSRMLFRNAFKKASQLTIKKVGKKIAETYLKKKGSEYAFDASRSITYQDTVEKKINLVTVLMDTFVNPYFGEFIGNAIFIGIDLETGNFKTESLINTNNRGLASFFVKSSIKALLNGKIRFTSLLTKEYGPLATVPYDIILHTYILEIGKSIEK